MVFFIHFRLYCKRSIQVVCALLTVMLLTACDQDHSEKLAPVSLLLPDGKEAPKRDQLPPDSLLEDIIKRGKLTVLTTNLPTTYYYDRDNNLAGPEYDMTQSFAESLQVDVEYKVYESTKEVLQALRKNEGDIAAAGLTVNENRKKEFDYGPVYQTTNEYLVCQRSAKRIDKIEEINGLEIIVAADSSYVESISSYPEMSWVEDQDLNTSDLLEQVAQKKVDCTISDSTLYTIERRYHTEIQKKYVFAEDSELAWMINKNNDKLKQVINDWFDRFKDNHDLSYTLEKYYGYVETFDYVDTHKFLARVSTRLPKYKEFFIDAAIKNDIEPSLLAAQSYQESHWDRKAKSPTGVRGIMMLTQPVAKSLGVTNRLDAEQNIYAGAKYRQRGRRCY